MLARWMEAHLEPAQISQLPLRLGPVPVHRWLSDAQKALLQDLELPLHSARVQLDDTDRRKQFFDMVLAEEGLTHEQLKLKGMREMFFSKGHRRVLCPLADANAEAGEDETHPGRKKLTLRFELPRGSYATLMVKRITRVEPIGDR
jgi:tRNA pseudouridine13 synthase